MNMANFTSKLITFLWTVKEFDVWEYELFIQIISRLENVDWEYTHSS